MRLGVPSPRGLVHPVQAAAVEVAWLGVRVAGYPLGFAPQRGQPDGHYRTADLSPARRGLLVGDVAAAGTPILLVHGMIDNRSVFTVFRRSLRRRGFGRVVTWNYPVLTSDVEHAAVNLAEYVELLCGETGAERIHLVGHSLGGLIARWYVQRLGGDERVDTLVTLATPHTGTRSAHLLPMSVLRQLRPDSRLIRELAAPAPACRTRFVAFWSDQDQIMVPREAARLEHPDLAARNVAVRGVGHFALPAHPNVVWEIGRTLATLGDRPAGRLVAPGESSGARPAL